MVDTRRAVLQRKYLSLGSGEIVAAAVFAMVAFGSVMPRLHGRNDVLSFWFALVPLLVILVQGGAYWLLARGWVGQRPMPGSLAALYRIFRSADAALLLVGLAGVLAWLPAASGARLLVALVWLFGVIEYVNYFAVRLAYPLHGWPGRVARWRTPRLMREVRLRGLSSGKARSAGPAEENRLLP